MRAVFLDFDTVGPGDIDARRLTDQLPDLELFAQTPPELVAQRIADSEIVLLNKVRLDAQALDAAPGLRLICLAATGTDNIDLDAARQRGVTVCNIRGYCTPSVVQHVFAMLLSLTNHIAEYRRLHHERAWADSAQFCLLDFPFRELTGKTLGIVGLGTLGRGVADIGAAFGMRVIAARRPYRLDDTETAPDRDTGGGVERVGFTRLLQISDVVSLHCPLTAATRNLIDARALAMMRDDSVLINTARGGLVDSRALATALDAGAIGAAGIDVLRQEPPVDPEPLIDATLPNLIVTPHIAWAAREARQRAVDEMAINIAAFHAGTPRNRVA